MRAIVCVFTSRRRSTSVICAVRDKSYANLHAIVFEEAIASVRIIAESLSLSSSLRFVAAPARQ